MIYELLLAVYCVNILEVSYRRWYFIQIFHLIRIHPDVDVNYEKKVYFVLEFDSNITAFIHLSPKLNIIIVHLFI